MVHLKLSSKPLHHPQKVIRGEVLVEDLPQLTPFFKAVPLSH